MEVTVHRELPFAAGAVWQVLRDFGNLHWLSTLFPRIEVIGEGIGMQRLLYPTADSRPAIHQLDALDEDRMRIRCLILRTHYLPITDVALTLGVDPLGRQRSNTSAHWQFSAPSDAERCDLLPVIEAWTMAISDRLNDHLQSHTPPPQLKQAARAGNA